MTNPSPRRFRAGEALGENGLLPLVVDGRANERSFLSSYLPPAQATKLLPVDSMTTRPAATLYIAGFATALIFAPMPSSGQSLLVIPDLNPAGVVERGDISATQCLVVEWLPPLSPEASEIFWTERRKSLLPGSGIALGTGRGAVYTELAEVLSGSWRFSTGTTLAVAAGDSATPAESEAKQVSTAFGRFVAGGGNLALQGTRPLVLANFGEHTGGALLLIPRVWLNVPELSSADGISDYGGEAAASILLQRRDNNSNPFLNFEVRGGIVIGSTEFYETIGRTEHERFAYLAPSLTFALQDQVNFGVSTFISRAFKDEKTVTLRLNLLNKSRTPDERWRARRKEARRQLTKSSGSTVPARNRTPPRCPTQPAPAASP